MTLPPDDDAVAVFDAGARLIRLAPGFAAMLAPGRTPPAPGAPLADVVAALIGGPSAPGESATPMLLRHLGGGRPEEIDGAGRSFEIALAPGRDGETRLRVVDVTRERRLHDGARRRETMQHLLVDVVRGALAGGDSAVAIGDCLDRLMRLCDCHAGIVAELRRLPSGAFEPVPLAARGGWVEAFAGPPPPVLLRAFDTLAPARADAGLETGDLGPTAVLPALDRGRLVAFVGLSARARPFDDDLMDCLAAAPAIVALLLSLRTHRRRRAQATRDLRASRGQVRAIFDTIREGAVIASAAGTVVGFNAAAERMFGFSPSEVLGRPFADLLAEAANPAALFAEGDGRRREISAKMRDGRTFPAELSVSRVAVDGEPLYVAILQDITERKRVARMQAELVTTVGHDLRSPLTAILGALRLVAGGAVDAEKSRDMLAIAERNGRRLMRLITDLLDLERIDAGMIAFRPAPCDLGAVLRQCVEGHRPLTEAKGLRVAWDLPAEPLGVEGDADRLAQIVTNILANAVRFSPEGGEIAIRATCGGDRVRVAISDRGPGIPADFLPVMFDRFRQVTHRAPRSGADAAEGSGLGLSIVRALVELHGGRVGALSPPGAGATVYFELPRKTLRKS